MRSSSFITLSIVFHLACIMAVAMVPHTQIDPDAKPVEQIEVAMPGPQAASAAPDVAVEAPAATPAPAVVVEEKPAPKPVVAKAKKVSKPKAAKPVEVMAAVAAEETEKLDPEVSPDDMTPDVTKVAEAAAAEPKPELIPVKEEVPAGIEAADAETEAISDDIEKAADPSPVQVADATATAPVASAPIAGPGSSQGNARSYLDLKQYSGNPAPVYPLSARQDKRQGEVELLYKVTAQGTVSDLKILKSSGHADLDNAAADAISRYRFVSGQEGWTKHPVVFSLKGPAEPKASRLRGVN